MRSLLPLLLAPWLLVAAGGSRTPLQPQRLETAQQALETDDPKAAEELFRHLLLERPDDAEALVGWARALWAQGRPQEGTAAIARAAQRRLRRGEPSSAADLLSTAVAVLPEDASLWTLLGDARIRARRFLGAERALSRAESLGARDAGTLLLLAASRWENGHTEEAEQTYRRLVGSRGDLGEAWYQLGRLLAWQGRFRESLEVLERAQRLGVEGPGILVEIARALHGESRRPDAQTTREEVVAAFAAATTASPRDYQLRYGLAQALAAAGNAGGARREMALFERLYRAHQDRTRDSGQRQALLAAARSSLARDDPRPALDALVDAAPVTEVHHLRAVAHEALGQRAAAISELEAAVALSPERIDLRLFLARLRSARG